MTFGKFLEVYHDYFAVYDNNDNIIATDATPEKELKKLYRRKIRVINTVDYTAEIHLK